MYLKIKKKSRKLCSVFMFFVQTYYTWYIQITLCELYICFLLYFMLATFFSYSCCYETRQINICVYTQFFSTISLSLIRSAIRFILLLFFRKQRRKKNYQPTEVVGCGGRLCVSVWFFPIWCRLFAIFFLCFSLYYCSIYIILKLE